QGPAVRSSGTDGRPAGSLRSSPPAGDFCTACRLASAGRQGLATTGRTGSDLAQNLTTGRTRQRTSSTGASRIPPPGTDAGNRDQSMNGLSLTTAFGPKGLTGGTKPAGSDARRPA